MRRIWMFIAVAALFLLLSFKADALTKGFSANSFYPTVDGGPYINVYDSSTLGWGGYIESTYMTYAYHPVQFVTGTSRKRGIIDHEFVQTLSFAFGLPDDHIQIGGFVPMAWALNWRNPAVSGSPGGNKLCMGDIELNAKIKLIDIKKYRVGAAIMPFVGIPTGRGSYYFGNGAISGGGRAILEINPIDPFHVSLNTGFLFRNEYKYLTTTVKHQLIWGLGMAYDITNKWTIDWEINGRAKLADLYAKKDDSQTETTAGVKYSVGNGLVISGGAAGGIVYGFGVPKFRVFAGVSYSPKLNSSNK